MRRLPLKQVHYFSILLFPNITGSFYAGVVGPIEHYALWVPQESATSPNTLVGSSTIPERFICLHMILVWYRIFSCPLRTNDDGLT